MENTAFFRAKKVMEISYLLLKSSCFELFRDGKYGLFFSQKVDGKIMFSDYWNVLLLNFSEMGNTAFFETKSWWKNHIYWLLKSYCSELFGDGTYGLFFSQKGEGKMIFTWSWYFHDIPGLRKYGFSCSVEDEEYL